MVNTKIRLVIFFAAKDGESIQSAKTGPGADCGSNHELLIARFRLKLKKTTRPFRYDLNHIPYDYTMQVGNRFKRLDLIWRRKWQPTPVLAWRIPGMGEPGGLPSMGLHRVGHD